MNRRSWISFVLCLIAVAGCGKSKVPVDSVAVVNDFVISKAAFEAEFKESSYSRTDTLESRKKFLDNLVDRKLILQDAQRMGLDREKNFLKVIEKFWEQSLLKIALDRKVTEIETSTAVSDEEIRQAYESIPAEAKGLRTLDQMRYELTSEIIRTKKSQAVDSWIAGLRKHAHVEVREELIKKNEIGGV